MSLRPYRRNQDVTFWVADSADGYGGYVYSTPVTLKGRWEEKAIMFLNIQGEEVISRAIVYLGQDVAIGDWLFEGDSVAADPSLLPGAYKVRNFESIPSLRNANNTRKAIL